MNHLPLSPLPLDAVVTIDRGEPLELARFLAHAEALAERLPKGGPVINLCQGRQAFSVTFAATILAGGCNLLPANRLKGTIDELCASFPGAVVVADQAQTMTGFTGPLLDPASALVGASRATTIPAVPADQLAAVVFTSGSSGPASRILKTWRCLHDSSLINLAELEPPQHSTLIATVPPQHMWGLEMSVLLPWFGPVAVVSSHPFFVADICRELESVEQPRVLVSTPVHLRALVESGLRLPEIERIYCATAPLSSRLARRIEQMTGADLIEVYGCSETGCLARRRTAHTLDWQPFAAFELHHSQNGTVARADHLPGPVPLMDELKFSSQRRFRLLGRHGDLVNIAGKRASLAELTAILLDIPGVIDGVIFQPPDDNGDQSARLAALVVAPGLNARDIRHKLAARIDSAFMPRPLKTVERLPRADTGKLPRQLLLQCFAQSCRQTG